MQTSEASLPFQGKPNTDTEAVGRGAHHASQASNGVVALRAGVSPSLCKNK